MFFVSARRAARINARTGHDPNDCNCRYWMGDFAGVNLRAVCGPCRAEREKR